ncbi:MAG TPA: chemotaxis protein CheW [Symbiobacteriaceae bacterium]
MGAEKQYVVFRLEGQRYGASVDVVREVTCVTTVTRLPNAPAYVEGVVDLRGEVIPVINLRRRLGEAILPPDPTVSLPGQEYVAGLARRHGEIVVMLDMAALLGSAS